MPHPVSPGPDTKPVVLHVLASFALGGIETWLVHVLRNQGQSPVRHEFLLTKDEPGPYEAEVRAMGIVIHRLRYDRNPVGWFFKVRRFFREHPGIAIVHTHGPGHFASATLAAAKSAGIPARIAHSHEAKYLRANQQTLPRRMLRAASVEAVARVATRRIGISDVATQDIAGARWRDDPATSVLLYGFDYSRNDGAQKRAEDLRSRLKIDRRATVIGHVGRFDPVKNHELLVRAFTEFLKRVPEAVLVLVGIGGTRPEIEALCEQLGVKDKVRFAGITDDVPAYMAMFDLFVLPSFSEGLGIVCLEAQAAGTRSLVSTGVASEVAVIPEALTRLPVDAGAERWAAEMHKLIQLPKGDAAKWRAAVEDSEFGIRRCVAELNEIYASELDRDGGR